MTTLYFLFFRGFGFVTFSDTTGVDKVLAHGTHDLDGKKVIVFVLLILNEVEWYDNLLLALLRFCFYWAVIY